MTAWLRALRRELGQGLVLLTFVVIAVAMAVLLWSKGAYWGGRWNSLAVEARDYLILIAPLAATLAAWQGGRAHRDQMGELLASTRRSALARHSSEVAAIALAAFGGWAVAMGLAALTILRLGGWGTAAAIFQILGVAPTLFAYVALGYAAGRLLPWRIVAPVVGVATYVLLGIPVYMSDAAAVLVGTGFVGNDVERPFAPLPFTLSIVGLSAAGLALLALISMERRPAPALAARGAAAAAVLVAVALAPITLATASAAARDREPTRPPVICTTDTGPRVCVHAQDRLLLAETTRQARAMLARLADMPGAPTWAGPNRPGVQDPSMLPIQSTSLDPWGRIDTTYGEVQLVNTWSLFDHWPACRAVGLLSDEPGAEAPPELQGFYDRTTLLDLWLTHDSLEDITSPDTDELSARMAASSEDQLKEYAGAVRAAARTCDYAALPAADELLAPGPR